MSWEDKVLEITAMEQSKIRRVKINKDSLRDFWDNIKCTSICIIGVPEGEEREKGLEEIFEEIIAKSLLNMEKETLKSKKHRVPYRKNPMPKHIN